MLKFLKKLKYIQKDIEGRRKVAQYYLDQITNPLIRLPEVGQDKGHVWHLFVIRTANRDQLQEYLHENGIQTLVHYPIPPHKQTAYKAFNPMSFPITEQIHKEVLSLPISAIMTDKEIEQVVQILNSYNG